MSITRECDGNDIITTKIKVRPVILARRMTIYMCFCSFAYVPSIRITPTTKQVQPLKLVKLHRVLREKSFNNSMSYALVEIRDEANKALYARDFCSLRDQFRRILDKGTTVYRTCYQYLHHSMSQVKEKQFWFLDNKYSTSNVLAWMGNFDNEHVVAKHAARIAQCFTSTEPSIRVEKIELKLYFVLSRTHFRFQENW